MRSFVVWPSSSAFVWSFEPHTTRVGDGDVREPAQRVVALAGLGIGHVVHEAAEPTGRHLVLRLCDELVGDLVDVDVRPREPGDRGADGLLGRGLPVDHRGEVAGRGAAAGDVDEALDAVRALVGEEYAEPATHRVADDVARVEAHHVLELPDVVDEVGEGVALVETVTGPEPEAVDRVDVQAVGELRDDRQPAVGAGEEPGPVDEDDGGARARLEVMGASVAHLHELRFHVGRRHGASFKPCGTTSPLRRPASRSW